MGVNLLPDVLRVLLRFRLGRYALLGDISQAFIQLLLDPADRDNSVTLLPLGDGWRRLETLHGRRGPVPFCPPPFWAHL